MKIIRMSKDDKLLKDKITNILNVEKYVGKYVIGKYFTKR